MLLATDYTMNIKVHIKGFKTELNKQFKMEVKSSLHKWDYMAPVIADCTLWRVTLYKYGFNKK